MKRIVLVLDSDWLQAVVKYKKIYKHTHLITA